MIHVKSNKTYYINEDALYFAENDLNDPNKVSVGLVAGTVIMVHVKGFIDYASNGNYQRFPIEAYKTDLKHNTALYIYVRINREQKKDWSSLVPTTT